MELFFVENINAQEVNHVARKMVLQDVLITTASVLPEVTVPHQAVLLQAHHQVVEIVNVQMVKKQYKFYQVQVLVQVQILVQALVQDLFAL